MSLNILDFNLFLCENCNTYPEKIHPPLSQQHPCKSWGPAKPNPFLKIWLEAQPPTAERGGAHYGPMMEEVSLKIVSLIKHN